MKKYYLVQFSSYRPLIATCSICNVETTFNGFMRYRLEESAVHIPEYQCQCCGKLKFGDDNQTNCLVDEFGNEVIKYRVALDQLCDCGGQFRRDKNIFCPACLHRRSEEENKSDLTSIFIDKAEYDMLSE
jgi:hypothetical protein